jgi:23S rRNA maturation-related 3'-5' exoribonuclease YhaM
VVEIAPRYDGRILDAVRALDDRTESIAEISRRVGVAAAQLGLPKPSYVHLRRYIVAHREAEEAERARREEIRKILWDAYYDFMQSRVVDAYEVAERIREAGR